MSNHLVIVDIQVVGCAEYGYERRKSRRLGLAVHAVSSVLRLVRPYYAQQVVVLKKVAAGRVTGKK